MDDFPPEDVDLTEETEVFEGDSRRYLRLSREASVEIRSGDGRILEGLLRDISLGSMYMYIDGIVSDFILLDEPVEINIFMEQQGCKLTITVEGRIVRTDLKGVAIEFDYHLKWWPIFTLLPGSKMR
jgi:hypothetical protein